MLGSWWSDNQTLIQVVAVYALLAFSVQIALKAGTFSLASVGFYGVGSYAAAYLAKHDWPTVGAVAAGVMLSVAAAWLLALLLVRLRDLYLGMATVAFDLIVGVVAVNWTSVTGGAAGLYAIPIRVGATTMTVVVLAVIVLLAMLQAGTIGRTLDVAREDEQLALTVAIDVRRYQRFAFTLSAALGALAGTFHALAFSAISPGDFDFGLIILALAMVIIGGFGSWLGALIGAVVVAYVPLKLTSLGQWWPVIYGSAMLLTAVYVPGGVYGALARMVTMTSSRVGRARRAQAGRAQPALETTDAAGKKAPS